MGWGFIVGVFLEREFFFFRLFEDFGFHFPLCGVKCLEGKDSSLGELQIIHHGVRQSRREFVVAWHSAIGTRGGSFWPGLGAVRA